MTESSVDLVDRYGRAPSKWRPLLLGLVAAVVVGFGGWVVWAMVVHGSPTVDADLSTYDVLDAHHVSVTVDVRLDEGAEATCRLRALAEDKQTVGDLAFSPEHGRNTVTVRTEREASSIEMLGCTAAD